MKGVNKRVVYWLAELKDPQKQVKLSEEHLDMKWLNLEASSQLANYSDFVTMLREYEEIIRKCLQ